MAHGFLELSVMTILSLMNSPYPQPETFYAVPSLQWRVFPVDGAPVFAGGTVSARVEPVAFNRLNPRTGLWDIHGGVTLGPVELVLGHVSEHGINRVVGATESKDYLVASYRVDF